MCILNLPEEFCSSRFELFGEPSERTHLRCLAWSGRVVSGKCRTVKDYKILTFTQRITMNFFKYLS